MWNADPFYWGSVPLGPNLRERGHSLPKCWYRSIGSWLRYNYEAGHFRQWNLPSMVFVEIYAKNDKFGYLNRIFGKLGATHDFGWWLVGKPMVDFLFALIELFSLSIMVPELWGETCTVRLFSQRIDLFAFKFYLVTVAPPVNHSWRQKTRDTALREGRDRIPLRSLFVTQYQSVTDRCICRVPYGACKAIVVKTTLASVLCSLGHGWCDLCTAVWFIFDVHIRPKSLSFIWFNSASFNDFSDCCS